MTEQGRVRDDVMGLDREIFALGAVVALGTIMTVLDLTVVDVAIPTLGRSFAASVSTIAFRVLQGLGAGMILPVGQTILAQAAEPQRMGRLMSVIGVPMLLAPVFGPVLAGAIVDAVSWRWMFYINLPVGAAAPAREITA